MEQPTPAIRLRVLGSLDVLDSQGGRLSVKGRGLLVRLWIAGREGVSRSQASRELWPEDDQPSASAKLRVALGRLKQSLPKGLILEQEGVLKLALDQVQCDLDEGKRALSRVLDEVDPQTSLAHGEEAMNWIEAPLLPDIEEPWLHEERAQWDELREEAAICLAQQAKEVGSPQAALLAAKAGLTINPTNSPLAEVGVLALIQLGDLKGAASHLNLWEKAAKELEPGFAFPPRLRRLALGGESPGDATEDQIDLAASLVERLIQDDPEAAMDFLGHRLFRREVQTRPEAALPLLERALEKSHLLSEASHRCLGRAALAAGLIQNHEKALAYGEKALALTQSLPLRKAILISLSFDYFWLGRSTEALAAIDRAIAAAEEIGDQIDCEIAKSQRATFWMLEARLEEATLAFDEAVWTLNRLGKVEELADMVVILHNSALALAHAGRWKEAEERLKQCQVHYQAHQPKHLLPLLTPLRGLVLFKCGERHKGAGILAKGVALACRNRQQKQLGTTLLMAAMALSESGRAVQSGLVLSAAEADLTKDKPLPSKPRSEWIETLRPSVVLPAKPPALVEACRLAVSELRQIEAAG